MSSPARKETTSVKLDKAEKDKAKEIFRRLGLSMGEAFNLFLHQVNLHKGLPFEVKIPNQETRKVIEETRQGVNVDDFDLSELKR